MNDQVAIQEAAQYGFDAGCYLTRYPDVAKSWDHAAATHYILYGRKEGRIPGCDAPAPVTQSNPNVIPTADQVSTGQGSNLNPTTKDNPPPATTPVTKTDAPPGTPAKKKLNPYILGGVGLLAIVAGIIIVKKLKK